METESYDIEKEVKQFLDSKFGVKGLVDSGITTIPRLFIQPPETLADLRRTTSTIRSDQHIIPTIDLSGVDSDLLRPTIVEKVVRASREFGFFQVVNHGIGVEVLERLLGAMKGFHEQSSEVKAQLYGLEMYNRASFYSNINSIHSEAFYWRDTLRIMLGPIPEGCDVEIPEICRNEVVEWNQHVTKLGEQLLGLLCEGLGVKTGTLKDMTFLESMEMLGHYYASCPQPDLTMGAMSHTDPGLLTILLQNHIGGLQVKYGEEWANIPPVPGSLVINIGNILQIISNDEYKSRVHRVLTNASREPRISAVVFFYPGDRYRLYGPLPELISPENPARFSQFTFTDYKRRCFTEKLAGKAELLDYYRQPV